MLYSFPFWRRYFWNFHAKEIHENYVGFTHDFDTISSIFTADFPYRLLDFGCGGGRLIPLYLDKRIPYIYCYDISEEALSVARSRFSDSSVHFVNSLDRLIAENVHLDLIICTRILQHIPPNEIDDVLKKILPMTKNVYLNEMTQPKNSYFMFAHNYEQIFMKYGFMLKRKGVIYDTDGNAQEWFLFCVKNFN